MCNLESQNRPTSAASNQIPLRDPQPSRHNKSKLKFKYFFTYFITLKFSLLQSTHTKQNNLLLQKKNFQKWQKQALQLQPRTPKTNSPTIPTRPSIPLTLRSSNFPFFLLKMKQSYKLFLFLNNNFDVLFIWCFLW